MRDRKVNTLKEFLFYIPPRDNRILYFEKIQLISFYVLSLLMLVAATYNIYIDSLDGLTFLVHIEIFFDILVLFSLILFWKTRNILYSQRINAFIIFLMMSLIIWIGGGRYGMSSFYFLAAFSVFFLVLDSVAGMILPVYFLTGMIIRFNWGSFGPDSVFFNPELRFRSAFVLIVSTIFGFMGSFSIRQLVRYLSRLAYTDSVTGLANIEKFKEIFSGEIARVNRTGTEGIILIGIKVLHMERVNANYGSDVGNLLLKEISLRLKQFDFEHLARWNGSMFMGILFQIGNSDLKKYITNLLYRLEEPVEVEEFSHSLHFAAALSLFPDDGDTPSVIQKNVLTMLNRNELVHKDIVFFNEEKHRKERERFLLLEALNSVDQSSEFSLVYQPKIQMRDQKCQGAEILLRWNRAGFGAVSPEDFIPLAEEMGIIRRITRWVIRKTFEDISGFDNPLLTFAINLSVVDLKNPELIPFISELLDELSISPSQVEFEVTEGVQADLDPQTGETLRILSEMGFSLAIDDFGTGYSSLSYLHKLKVNNLKIDKSFIQLIDRENLQERYPVIDAIISMGLSMGLTLTAEGVETREQAEYLIGKGCSLAQGWFYSKGLPWDSFLDYLQDSSV